MDLTEYDAIIKSLATILAHQDTLNQQQAVTNRHVLWIHAVSVGEVSISTQLIRALEPRAPGRGLRDQARRPLRPAALRTPEQGTALHP